MLSAAALTPDGQPSKFTMAGPWVGIAAPGENIVSVSNRDGGGLANGLPDDHQQLVSLSGTSYAAGYVSGVAALVRSKYPALTATQVVQPHHRDRAQRRPRALQRRRHRQRGPGGSPDLGTARWQPARRPSAKPVAVPPAPAPKDTTPRTVAFAGTAALALVVAAAAAIVGDRRAPTKGTHLVSQLRSIPMPGSGRITLAAAGRGARGDGVPLALDAATTGCSASPLSW